MREYFQAPVAQRMALTPFRELLPAAERVTRGISDIPSCNGTRRSPEGISAGGGGGHLSDGPKFPVNFCNEKSMDDIQTVLDLRNKLASWGVTPEGKGQAVGAASTKAAVLFPVANQARSICANVSDVSGEWSLFDFENDECSKSVCAAEEDTVDDLPWELRSAFSVAIDGAFSSFDVNLRSDVNAILARLPNAASSMEDNLEVLAEALRSRGYKAQVQVSSGSYKPSSMNFNLKHRYICCVPSSDCFDNSPRIVDPSFKDQFGIACPTPAYSKLMELVPKVFVGTAISLQAVIETLSNQMTESFRIKAMPTPPWRRVQALYSKWLPLMVEGHGQCWMA